MNVSADVDMSSAAAVTSTNASPLSTAADDRITSTIDATTTHPHHSLSYDAADVDMLIDHTRQATGSSDSSASTTERRDGATTAHATSEADESRIDGGSTDRNICAAASSGTDDDRSGWFGLCEILLKKGPKYAGAVLAERLERCIIQGNRQCTTQSDAN